MELQNDKIFRTLQEEVTTRMGISYKKHDGRFADLAASPVPSRVGLC